jgi:succinate dehydrogenase/fumarate reductase flavoprotein subunit
VASEYIIESDVLVVGGGMSGIFAALKAREEGANVTITEKGFVGRSGAAFIAEGYYSVFNPGWGHKLPEWMDQIAIDGDYLYNPEWAEVTLMESYARYQDLEKWGVKFLNGVDDKPLVFKRGAIESRVLGNGWTYLPKLREILVKAGVRILDRVMVTDLLKEEGRIVGAVGFQIRSGEYLIFPAKATVICTGGGDGEAMAYRAGAALTGKEFLIGTGAYRYAGKEYYSDHGHPEKIVPPAGKTIKPRPMWSGGAIHYIDRYLDAEGGKVNRYSMGSAVHSGKGPLLWNLEGADPQEIKDTLREIEQGGTGFKLERIGFDLRKGGFFSSGAVVTGMGGNHGFHGGGSGIVSAGTDGSTSLPGLYGGGDAYSSRGVGAKYPYWGFGLRNATVTGARAGQNAARFAKQINKVGLNKEEIGQLKKQIYAPLERVGGFDKDWVQTQLKALTGGYYVYLVRHGERLKAALTLIEFLKEHVEPLMYARPRDGHGLMLVHETKSLILMTETALRAAIFRTESRGSHYREDYPQRKDPEWLAIVKVRQIDGEAELEKELFPKKWWPDLSVPYRERYPMEYMGED